MSIASIAGTALALGVAFFASLVGLNRDRALYPTILIVIGSYYVLFAIMAGAVSALIAEILVFAAFTVIATVGFWVSLWIVVGGLAAHGVFDLFHGELITNAGVPDWWPVFCLTFDLVAAACLEHFSISMHHNRWRRSSWRIRSA